MKKKGGKTTSFGIKPCGVQHTLLVKEREMKKEDRKGKCVGTG